MDDQAESGETVGVPSSKSNVKKQLRGSTKNIGFCAPAAKAETSPYLLGHLKMRAEAKVKVIKGQRSSNCSNRNSKSSLNIISQNHFNTVSQTKSP